MVESPKESLLSVMYTNQENWVDQRRLLSIYEKDIRSTLEFADVIQLQWIVKRCSYAHWKFSTKSHVGHEYDQNMDNKLVSGYVIATTNSLMHHTIWNSLHAKHSFAVDSYLRITSFK